MFGMRRREFITLVGGAAAWPIAAHAQQPAMPVVGFVSSSNAQSTPHMTAAFRVGLKENGFTEGENVANELAPILCRLLGHGPYSRQVQWLTRRHSRAFIKKAREIGADENKSAVDELFGQTPKPHVNLKKGQ